MARWEIRLMAAGMGAVACLWGAALAGAQDPAPPPEAPPAAEPAPVAEAPPPPPAPKPVRVAAFTAPKAVTYGRTVAIAGRIAPARRTAVAIERLEGRRWVTITTVRSDPRGRFRAEIAPRADLSVRARPAVAGGEPGSRRNIDVRRRLDVRVSTHSYESIAGLPFTVSGTVVPARDGERVLLEGSRNGRAYQPIARMVVRKGRVGGTVTPPAGGTWRFRLSTAERRAPDRSDATAPRRVFDANPHSVPASSPVYIVQKLSEMQLYYYERGQLRRVMPVVFGKPSTPTPVGNFRVYSKAPGPGAVFGPAALWYHGNYGMHGTNQEHLLSHSWRYYSAGCTRNYNANILWLHPRVPIGTPVRNIR